MSHLSITFYPFGSFFSGKSTIKLFTVVMKSAMCLLLPSTSILVQYFRTGLESTQVGTLFCVQAAAVLTNLNRVDKTRWKFNFPPLSLCLTLPYLISPRFASLHLALPHPTSPHLASPCLTLPHLASPWLTLPHLTLPLTLSQLTSPHLTSPHLTSPHLTSPHLTSPHLTLSNTILHFHYHCKKIQIARPSG